MSEAKKGRSTLAGERMTADAPEDSGRPQTADWRPQTVDEGKAAHRRIDASPPLRLCHSAFPTSHSALDPLFPTETEIYILPDGQVLFADLPAELADLAAQLGSVLPCAVER
ncbi:MAG: hypothetical protein KF893_18770 [Caldilineaceae bacterium]|nr:hypothetical protein [Caldilineaceae bacterium]